MQRVVTVWSDCSINPPCQRYYAIYNVTIFVKDCYKNVGC